MEEIHDVLSELLKPISTLPSVHKKFYEEMLRFSGTREELDTRLERFQTQLQEQQIVMRKQAATALEQLKGILTIEQGELLWDIFPSPMGDMRGRMRLQQQGALRGSGARSSELRTQSDFSSFKDLYINRMCKSCGFNREQSRMLLGHGSGLQQIVDILKAKLQYVEG